MGLLRHRPLFYHQCTATDTERCKRCAESWNSGVLPSAWIIAWLYANSSDSGEPKMWDSFVQASDESLHVVNELCNLRRIPHLQATYAGEPLKKLSDSRPITEIFKQRCDRDSSTTKDPCTADLVAMRSGLLQVVPNSLSKFHTPERSDHRNPLRAATWPRIKS
jgi:hypothetical protein